MQLLDVLSLKLPDLCPSLDELTIVNMNVANTFHYMLIVVMVMRNSKVY